MSTQTAPRPHPPIAQPRAAARQPHVAHAQPAKAQPAQPTKVERKEATPLHCKRKPGMKAEAAMRSAVWELKEAGYDYAERIELFRLANMQTEVRANKGVKKHAAKKLGISRAALCAYLKRGKELL